MPSTLSPRLVKAIASGDAAALRKAIEKGDSISDGALSEPMKVVDSQTRNVRESAATLAVKFENMEMICAVLDAGTNVHVQNSTGDTPASIAAYRNLPGVIPLLYIHGSDLGQVTTGNLHHTPLAWAAWNDSVVSAFELLSMGAAVDVGCHKGRAALAWGIRQDGSEAMTDLLLSYGANPNHAGDQGTTALHCAATNKEVSPEALALLLDAGALSSHDSEGKDPAARATEAGNTTFFTVFNAHPTCSDPKTVMLISDPAHSQQVSEDMVEAIESGSLQQLRTLCAFKRPLPQREENGSALFAAVNSRNIQAIRLLTTLGIGGQDTDRIGDTPLHRHVDLMNDTDRRDIVTLRDIARQSHLRAQNSTGMTAVRRAQCLGKFAAVSTLLSCGGMLSTQGVRQNANAKVINPLPLPGVQEMQVASFDGRSR